MQSTQILCLSNNTVPSGSRYWGEHGLSFYIESGDGLRVLFDTGQSGDVLFHNARLAGVSLGGLDFIVLSHGHYDHTGGLMKVLEMNEGVPVVAHPAVFEPKLARRDGELRDIGLPFTFNELDKHCELRLKPRPAVLGGGVSATGEIKRMTPYEGPEPDLLTERDGGLAVDPVMDDQSVVVVTGGHVILLCGCCHAGIVNTVEQVKREYGRYPDVVAGGLHVEKAGEERLSRTVKALKASGVKKVIAGHCSGDTVPSSLDAAGIDAGRLAAGMRIVP